MPYVKKTTYRRKPVKKTRKPSNRYKSLPNLVKREIQKAAEVKRTGQDPQNYTFNADNSTMSNPVDLLSQFCVLQTGPDDGNRIGEQVRTKRAILKILVQATQTDILPIGTTDEAQILQLFIGYHRETPGILPTSPQLVNIFDDGATGAPANGSLLSLMRSVNRDVFRISHYKKLKIGHADATAFANNDFPAYRMLSIDITKHLGLLRYTGSGAVAPNNKHLYMFCNWVNARNGVLSDRPPRVQYYLDFTYTDL